MLVKSNSSPFIISVITLTHNNFEELLRTVDSLRNLHAIERIVVNGGSCPRTKSYLALQEFRSVTEPDQGIADGFNKGILMATGDAIAFLNSGDILVQENYYTRAANLFQHNPEIDYVYADLCFLDPLIGKTVFHAKRKAPFNPGHGMIFPHPTLVVRKEVMRKLGGFNLNYKIAMDFEWLLRLLKGKYIGQFIDAVPIKMNGGGVSLTSELFAIEECNRALLEQGLYSGAIRFAFLKRKGRFLFRQFILRFFGKKTLGIFKKLKKVMD